MKILSTIESRQLKKGELKEIIIDNVIYDLTSYQKGVDTFLANVKNAIVIPVVIPSKNLIALRDTEIKELQKATENNLDYIIINRNGIAYKVTRNEAGDLYATNNKENELIVVR